MADQKITRLFMILFIGTRHPYAEGTGDIETVVVTKVRAMQNVAEAKKWATENLHCYLLPNTNWLSKHSEVFDHKLAPEIYMVKSDHEEFISADIRIHFQGLVVDFCEMFWIGPHHDLMVRTLKITDPKKQINFIWDLFMKEYDKKLFLKEREHGSLQVKETILGVIKIFVDSKTTLAKSATP